MSDDEKKEVREMVIIVIGHSYQCKKTCQKLVKQGHSLVIVSPDRDKLEDLQAQLDDEEGKTLIIDVDVEDITSVEAMMDMVTDRFGNANMFLHFSGGGIGELNEDVQDFMELHIDEKIGTTTSKLTHDWWTKDKLKSEEYEEEDRDFSTMLAERVGGIQNCFNEGESVYHILEQEQE